jgi:hypothetical protein
MPNKTIEIAATCSLTAAKDETELPKIKIVANNGDPMDVGFGMPVVVKLSGIRFRSSKTPIVMDHDLKLRIGHTTNINKKGPLSVEGVVSSTSQSAQEFVADSKLGFPWQSSIGASIEQMEELAEGKKRRINGKTVVGPMLIATASVLNEVSVTTLGADSGTSAVAASKRKGSSVMPKAVREDVTKESLGEIDGFMDYVNDTLKLEWDSLSDDQAIALHASFETVTASAEPAKPAKPAKPVVNASVSDDDSDNDDISSHLTASRKQFSEDIRRINQIHATVDSLATEGIQVEASVVADAIENGMSVDRFELTARRKSRRNAVIHSTKPKLDIDTKVLECALARQLYGSPKWIESSYDEKTLDAADHKSMRGIGLHYLLDLSIRAANETYTGSRKCNDYIRAALHSMRTIKASGFSTLSVTNILENVGNKQLIASYEMQSTVWRQICAVRNLNDFKVHSRYQLDSLGSYRKVGPDGELKHVELTDAKYTLQGETYGAMIELTRPDIFNDDLNAFEQIPTKLGEMAAIRIEEAVFVLLLSNPGSFFSVGNGNIITGGSPLSLANLTISEQKFMNQTNSNGKPILIQPKVLLVGTQDSVLAANIFNQTMIQFGGGDTTDGAQFVNNPHVGKFIPAVSPYLNNTNITDQDGNAISGQSSTASYLFADPNQRAAMNVGFLNGNQVPVIESDDVDFSRLGMSWRSYHDWGVGMEDPKAAVLDAGA